jgi:hypothetical protein
VAVAFDAASSSNTGGSSLTFSHTCSGSDRLLIVGVSVDSGHTVSGVTYAGAAMTQIGTATAGNVRAYLFSKVAPATGANNVVVSLAGGGSSETSAGAISFTGVSQANPLGTVGTNSGTSGTTASVAVSSDTDEIVVDVVSVNSSTPTVGADQTSRWADARGSTKGAGSTETGAASTTMSWTVGSGDHWAIVAIPVRPVKTFHLAAALAGAGSVAGAIKVTRKLAAALAGAGSIPTAVLDVYRTNVAYALTVDWDNDGNFTGAYDNITGDAVVIESWRGRDTGPGIPILGKAGPGKLVARLLNTSGKYSSYNSSSPIYHQALPGRKVQLRAILPVSKTLWTGYLRRITPDVLGAGGLPMVTLEAEGPLSQLVEVRNKSVPNSGALVSSQITTLLDDMGWPAADRSIDTADVTTGYWAPGGKSVLEALRELEETELGFLYEDPDGRIVFQKQSSRTSLGRSTVSQATFSDAPGATLQYSLVEQTELQDQIFNEIYTEYRLLTTGALATLWSLTTISPNTIAAGASLTFVAEYPSAADTTGKYVNAWTTPVVATDIAHTGGTLSVGSVVKESNRMTFTVTNTHGTDTATLTTVQARGTPVTIGSPVKLVKKSTASQTALGRRVLEWRAPFYANQGEARTAAAAILAAVDLVKTQLRIEIPANRNSAHLAQAMSREISDHVTITAANASKLGISAQVFHIEGIGHRISDGGTKHVAVFELSGVSSDVTTYAAD